MTEHAWARWAYAIEQAADSVAERWQGRSVAHEPEAASLALWLAQWWLEEGKARQAARLALASLALDPTLHRHVDTLLGRLAVKSRPKPRGWLVGAFVADLEGV